MNPVLPVHPPAGFRRPRNNLFVIRGGGFGQVPAMQSPLVQSGLYPVPLASALPVAPGPALQVATGPAPMTPAGLSTPVLGIPLWYWGVGIGVYWLLFRGGGRGAGVRRG